ncbi:MAG: carbonic anhydrase [Gemmataceae bacterium]
MTDMTPQGRPIEPDEEASRHPPATRSVTRRCLFAGAASAAAGFTAGWLLRRQPPRSPPAAEPVPETAEQGLERLREGNRRFVAGTVRHGHEDRTWRTALVADQHPFAVVLGCSDSRVPIELLFDQGFGDLFIIRVAGNVIATDVVGSIAYAVAHLHARLLVVLGHEGCGAVTAALQTDPAAAEPASVEALARLIRPGLRDLAPDLDGPARLRAAVEANVRWSMGQLAAIPAGRRILDSGQLRMVGAVYELTTGQVRFLTS